MSGRLRFLILVIGLIATTSCAASADQFVGGSSTFVTYIAWTSDGSGHLEGQLQEVSLAGTKVNRISAAFTGTRNGSEVSLVFPILSQFSGQTWTGTLGFRSLSLELPNNAQVSLSSGSFTDFRARIATLEQQASVADAQAQRLAAVTDAVNQINAQWNQNKAQLAKAFDQLKSMFPIPPPDPENPRTVQKQYADVMAALRNDLAHEQDLAANTPLTCYQLGEVRYAAGQVSYAYGQLKYQDGTFHTFEQNAMSDLTAVSLGLDRIDQLYPQIKARYREYAKIVPSAPTPDLSQAQINQMKQQVLPMLETFRARLSKIQAIARDADSEGEQIKQKANDLPDSLSCSN